jgi:hypothetical protein
LYRSLSNGLADFFKEDIRSAEFVGYSHIAGGERGGAWVSSTKERMGFVDPFSSLHLMVELKFITLLGFNQVDACDVQQ